MTDKAHAPLEGLQAQAEAISASVKVTGTRPGGGHHSSAAEVLRLQLPSAPHLGTALGQAWNQEVALSPMQVTDQGSGEAR